MDLFFLDYHRGVGPRHCGEGAPQTRGRRHRALLRFRFCFRLRIDHQPIRLALELKLLLQQPRAWGVDRGRHERLRIEVDSGARAPSLIDPKQDSLREIAVRDLFLTEETAKKKVKQRKDSDFESGVGEKQASKLANKSTNAARSKSGGTRENGGRSQQI